MNTGGLRLRQEPVSPVGLVELASGIDTIEMSGQGRLPDPVVVDLEEARLAAIEADDGVPFDLGSETFELQPFAWSRYRYRLRHPHAMVALTASEHLPMVYGQLRSSFIHSVGAERAVEWLSTVLESADLKANLSCSRLDLYADLHGFSFLAEDRRRFVSRGRTVVTYEIDGELSGLTFGRRGTGPSARIYDKTREALRDGDLDAWKLVWADRYRETERVVRVEFEVRRATLKELQIRTLEEVLAGAGGMWAYMTDQWLSLRVPTTDQTRSRWPVDPIWKAVRSASVRGGAVGLTRMRKARLAGSMRRTIPQARGYVAKVGALSGCSDLECTVRCLTAEIREYDVRVGELFEDVLARKAREVRYT